MEIERVNNVRYRISDIREKELFLVAEILRKNEVGNDQAKNLLYKFYEFFEVSNLDKKFEEFSKKK